MNRSRTSPAFSLIELLIYIAVFAISSTFLVAILTTVTRVQLEQRSANEVNNQLSFVKDTVQRLVYESSVVELDAGTATSTLVLRMASSSLDPTKVYSSSSAIYLQEGTSTPLALTDDKVTIDSFSVRKLENAGGKASVHLNIGLAFNTPNPQAKFSRVAEIVIARISAATFDSSILPNTDAAYDLGGASARWDDGYFGGNIGVGDAPVTNARIKSSGDIAISSSSAGLVLKSANGTCYRVTVSNGGALSSNTSTTCP